MKRFIIQITKPHGKKALSVQAARRILRDTGVVIDEAYGVLLLDPQSGKWVLRGTADETAKEKANALPGVQLFSDGPIALATEPLSLTQERPNRETHHIDHGAGQETPPPRSPEARSRSRAGKSSRAKKPARPRGTRARGDSGRDLDEPREIL